MINYRIKVLEGVINRNLILHIIRCLINNHILLSLTASNAGSELYISPNTDPNNKKVIAYVDGGFPSQPYEYDR